MVHVKQKEFRFAVFNVRFYTYPDNATILNSLGMLITFERRRSQILVWEPPVYELTTHPPCVAYI